MRRNESKVNDIFEESFFFFFAFLRFRLIYPDNFFLPALRFAVSACASRCLPFTVNRRRRHSAMHKILPAVLESFSVSFFHYSIWNERRKKKTTILTFFSFVRVYIYNNVEVARFQTHTHTPTPTPTRTHTHKHTHKRRFLCSFILLMSRSLRIVCIVRFFSLSLPLLLCIQR